MSSGGDFIATGLNDPRYLGDVTIQTAREVASGKKVPEFVDAGTTLVTKKDVDQYKLDGCLLPTGRRCSQQNNRFL